MIKLPNGTSAPQPSNVPHYDINPPAFATRLLDTPIDAARPIKIIVIGAGLSGILAGIVFPRKVQNLEIVIYEKNDDVGGTWFENNYPGVACDVPSHVYQYTFENNTQWSNYYAPGSEIQNYLKGVATKYGVYKYTKFNNIIRKAEWRDEAGGWSVEIENTKTGEKTVDTSDILISGVGILNQWKWPDIPGLNGFKGKLLHSANYEKAYDLSHQRVALIGGGSTGIQILPQIQPKAARVDHYMKGKTWIPPLGIGAEGLLNYGGDPTTRPEDLKRFREDPSQYLAFRHDMEGLLNKPVSAIFKNTDDSKMLWQACEDNMRAKLAAKPEIFEALKPDFPPGCRRLTPGPGYLEALIRDNVQFIPTGIKQVYDTGIETEDGKKREVDTIICATGFDGVYKQHFPVIGRGGAVLGDIWEKDIPEAYLSLFPPEMPNFFNFLGPNGGPGYGSNVPFLENACAYMLKAIKKIQREHIKSMVPKREAIKDFGSQTDAFFGRTIFSASCHAWWKHKGKKDGRLLALWPGGCVHGRYAFENPRWEDFDYVLHDETGGNRFAWFGNGLTTSQENGEKTTGYLDEVLVTPDETPYGSSLSEQEASIQLPSF